MLLGKKKQEEKQVLGNPRAFMFTQAFSHILKTKEIKQAN